MRWTQTHLSLKQRILIIILPVTAVILLVGNMFNVQQIAQQEKQQTREIERSYKQQSFSFIMNQEGDVVGDNSAFFDPS